MNTACPAHSENLRMIGVFLYSIAVFYIFIYELQNVFTECEGRRGGVYPPPVFWQARLLSGAQL